MIREQVDYNPFQRGIVLDSGVFPVVVLHGILAGRVRRHSDRDFLDDDLADFVAVLPVDIAELFIERNAPVIMRENLKVLA